ncbi:Response regulator receiver domain-containing protein [Desulfacinum hydrothermale DSM 13146]|uniref:Response regulator receiver domain-containing protein n=1 Tax=Desulfacinum hydrothermale DSM 13146 TaxID=1121390 RepID=A0A1W1XCS8_9BACT|nr:response regulator [Desulfacinum hydrothermale]SMC21697.1 Response regulator receiver domain-containing protein [Desulfacinum hydrothermale DSM 13146]
MHTGLNVIVVDDDRDVLAFLQEVLRGFYVWGDVLAFDDPQTAAAYCLEQPPGVAVFVLDVYMGSWTAFDFLERVQVRFPMAAQDAVIITGNASDEVVSACVEADITHLLEKPLRPYALQLAVRSIVSKYIKFARRLLTDPQFADQLPVFH